MSFPNRSLQRAVRHALLASAAGAAVVALPIQAADEGTIQEVVVTGSRISTPNMTSISPVTAIAAEDIAATGKMRVEDIINQLPQAMEIAHRWWRLPKAAPRIVARRSGSGPTMPASPNVGLLFTGGVDSFFSLLNAPVHVEALVYVVDSDLTAAPAYRPSHYEGRFRELAKELGRRAIVVRSNLRRHPAFKWLSWPQLHGSAFIGAAHLLQPSLGTLIRIGNQFLFSGSWWIVVFPVMQLCLLVVAVNLLGDWLRDVLNPKLR